MRLALQLASFHNLLKSDFEGTLMKISDAGFKNVEVTELAGETNQHFCDTMLASGLNTISLHVELHQLRARFVENIAYAELLEAEWLVVPVVQLDEYGDGWRKLGTELAEIGRQVAEHGRKLAFHPNQAEFRMFGEETGLDGLYEGSGRELDFEFDLAQTYKANADPLEWLRKLNTKVPLLVMDMGSDEATSDHSAFAKWREVKPTAVSSGIPWLIVQEQEGAGDRFAKLKDLHELFLSDGLLDD